MSNIDQTKPFELETFTSELAPLMQAWRTQWTSIANGTRPCPKWIGDLDAETIDRQGLRWAIPQQEALDRIIDHAALNLIAAEEVGEAEETYQAVQRAFEAIGERAFNIYVRDILPNLLLRVLKLSKKTKVESPELEGITGATRASTQSIAERHRS